jgi:acyl-CoA dehydrogenase
MEQMMTLFYETYGFFFATGYTLWIALFFAAVFLAFGFRGTSLWLWSITGFIALVGFAAPVGLIVAFLIVATVFNLPPIRRTLLSAPIMKTMIAMKFLPKISETERTALEAGDVWVEAELFSGKPNFKRLRTEVYPELTAEEQAFMDGPVEKACQLVDEWQAWQEKDLPKKVWDYIKKEKFLGMIIPKEYGGLGFSAMAHSEVIQKLASRSVPLCISVMVPNSLGPAELLTHYGTQKQKDEWLERLANGDEIPCFGLTEPHAGSDAGSIQSHGVLFKDEDGVLKIRLNWNKRWITLAAISTVVGLAFRLRDPENFLGKGEDLGITCALIPSTTPGVVLGQRHDPLGVPFYNCPTQGHDVIVTAEDSIIGGLDFAGKGWAMLMETLGAGRGISLPAQATGGAKFCSRVTGAHSVVRRQFGVSIGQFEGVAEPLARIAGLTYLMEGARRYTLGAIDGGSKPPVVTAIAKYNFTELGRIIINDAMDVTGGQGISRGPRNLLAPAYISAPIGITVEGANIMTRTLIIFGQGALRAHPYAFQEVAAVERGDSKAFDHIFWGHVGHVIRNTFRAILLTLTRGYLAVPPSLSPTAKHYRRLAWTSATFAIMADLAMATLGGKLKIREMITGRFADAFSWMYLTTAALRRFEAEGERPEDLALLDWGQEYGYARIQEAFDGIFGNFNVPVLGWIFKGPIRLWARFNALGSGPSDHLDLKVAQIVQEPSEQRDRLTSGIFTSSDLQEPIGRLENAFLLTKQTEATFKKIRKAVRQKQIPKLKGAQANEAAFKAGVITEDEFKGISKAEEARDEVIQVDSFTLEEYRLGSVSRGTLAQKATTPEQTV